MTPIGYALADGGHIIINDLLKLGVDVTLIGLTQKFNSEEVKHMLDKAVKIKKLTLFESHDNVIKKLLNYVYLLIRLFFICLTKNNFYVYVPSNTSLFSLFFLNLFKKKYGLYVRGAIKHSRLMGKVRHYGFLNRIYIKAIRRAQYILVTGPYLYNDIKLINKNTELVAPMISVSTDDLYESRDFDSFQNLLFVGRIDKEKGVEELIDAAKLLTEEGIQYNLSLVGGGDSEYIERMTRRIAEYKLIERITMTGRVDDAVILKKLYQNADIFVFPSHHEGFPRVLYEAMTFGLPIIATDLEAYSGSMVHNENALLVPLYNPEAIAETIVALQKSKESRINLAKNSLEFMKSHFKITKGKSHASQLIDWQTKRSHANQPKL